MPDQKYLEAYASLVVEFGINVQPKDRLLVHSSSDAVELTRCIVRNAYEAGAENVDVLWRDTEVARARFNEGEPYAARTVSSDTMARLAAFDQGDLLLYINTQGPADMAGISAGELAAFSAVNNKKLAPVLKERGTLERPWCILTAPGPSWASAVFSKAATPADAVEMLWEAIFKASRVDTDDPRSAWTRHIADLNWRSDHLTARRYSGLRYRSRKRGGTDLSLKLAEGAVWVGGSVKGPTRPNEFLPNFPTEEVFTAPHMDTAAGVVKATKPLVLHGQVVEDMELELSNGQITSAKARKGQQALDELLRSTDKLGEVAMVPLSSPISAQKLVWYNTLFDENDGCHIAIGNAYPVSVKDGTGKSRADLTKAGLNHSSEHIDFVVGDENLSVYGTWDNGNEELIIDHGEWAF